MCVLRTHQKGFCSAAGGSASSGAPAPPTGPGTGTVGVHELKKGMVVEFFDREISHVGLVEHIRSSSVTVIDAEGNLRTFASNQLIDSWGNVKLSREAFSKVVSEEGVRILQHQRHWHVCMYTRWKSMSPRYKRMRVTSESLARELFQFSSPPHRYAASVLLSRHPHLFKKGDPGSGYRPRANHAVELASLSRLAAESRVPRVVNAQTPPLPLYLADAGVVLELASLARAKNTRPSNCLGNRLLQIVGMSTNEASAQLLLDRLPHRLDAQPPPYHSKGFSPHAMREAQDLQRKPHQPRELYPHPVIAIDSPNTDCLEDAMSIESLADGGCKLTVHVTDASAYIDPSGALFAAALDRVSSVYSPASHETLFPRAIYKHLSIDRPSSCVISLEVTLDSNGQPTAFDIRKRALPKVYSTTFHMAAMLLASHDSLTTPMSASEVFWRDRLSLLLQLSHRNPLPPSFSSWLNWRARFVAMNSFGQLVWQCGDRDSLNVVQLVAWCNSMITQGASRYCLERTGLPLFSPQGVATLTSPLRRAADFISLLQLSRAVDSKPPPFVALDLASLQTAQSNKLKKLKAWENERVSRWQMMSLHRLYAHICAPDSTTTHIPVLARLVSAVESESNLQPGDKLSMELAPFPNAVFEIQVVHDKPNTTTTATTTAINDNTDTTQINTTNDTTQINTTTTNTTENNTNTTNASTSTSNDTTPHNNPMKIPTTTTTNKNKNKSNKSKAATSQSTEKASSNTSPNNSPANRFESKQRRVTSSIRNFEPTHSLSDLVFNYDTCTIFAKVKPFVQ